MILFRHQLIVDSCDQQIVDTYSWSTHNRGYAITRINGRVSYLHRLICPTYTTVDHINGNKLDNRRCNLRECTVTQNNQNVTKRKTNTSGYKGVVHRKERNLWIAQIRLNGVPKFIGSYSTPEQAALAYNKKAIELHGEFANINII